MITSPFWRLELDRVKVKSNAGTFIVDALPGRSALEHWLSCWA